MRTGIIGTCCNPLRLNTNGLKIESKCVRTHNDNGMQPITGNPGHICLKIIIALNTELAWLIFCDSRVKVIFVI